MAPYVSLIQGVDSLKLLIEINKQAQKHHRIIDCLLQVFIAEEETKFGWDEHELEILLHDETLKTLEHVRIAGLMGMATFTENQDQIKREFLHLKSIFNRFQILHTPNCHLSTLSMGMSGDYGLAIECGSTMVRVGSSIFGVR
jgi:pyridoxal phosphate enzyme (YggS family)